ncbi:hypothetical protein TNCV_4211331 [Trichonephila clavipes]|nr:hypothetical protein TNCV_4211331 [Trichonephila clavipes]
MATGSYLTPNYSRSQSEIQGDLHNVGYQFSLDIVVLLATSERFSVCFQAKGRPILTSVSKLLVTVS